MINDQSRQVIAVDLGGESGRVVSVRFDGKAFHMSEGHRFPNVPVQAGGTMYWDVLRLWNDIRTGVDALLPNSEGIAVDTWGVDFALLDRDGKLLANPVHYRDSRTEGMMEWVFERVSRREVFERTGIQFMVINTLYQLASLVHQNSPWLESAHTFLPIPDLFNYWLTGNRNSEYTHSSTMQLVNPKTGDWDTHLLESIGIPRTWFPPLRQTGTVIGYYHEIPVLASGTHDTSSAVVAVPTTTPDYAYISSGTWSLMGLEVNQPVITDDSYAANITNEGGVFGTYRLLKNVMGLWLAQQCRSAWREQGLDYDYGKLIILAHEAEPFRSFIDPDDPLFLPHGDMPGRIQEFCRRTGQPIPETPGQIIRTVYESLALKYRHTLDILLHLSGRTVNRIHIVGGGVKNELLCQMTADACNRMVIAGPVEATALGNAMVQFVALGVFKDIAEARTVLSRTTETQTYQPKYATSWEQAYERFTALITNP